MSSKPLSLQPQRASHRRQHGVTLIELMVGLVIGMLTTVVIAQALSMAEERRRGTSEGSDVQVNGALAVFSLQREIMAAGYALAVRRDAFGCTVRGNMGGAMVSWRLAPMTITNGGADGESDTFVIRGSDKETLSAPMRLTAPHEATDTVFGVSATIGVEAGDHVIAVPKPAGVADTCSVHRVTVVSPGGFEHDTDSMSAVPAGGHDVATTLINVGTLSDREYSVANGGLSLRNFSPALGDFGARSELYPNVVNLQVFYGKDSQPALAPDNRVDVYDTVQPMSSADWRNVRTVRLVLVTKSGLRERDEVTTEQPRIDLGAWPPVEGSQGCGPSQCLTMKVDTDPDWKHYRYKVFSTVVPLRNLLWNVNL